SSLDAALYYLLAQIVSVYFLHILATTETNTLSYTTLFRSHQRASDGNSLLLPARELCRTVIGAPTEFDALQHRHCRALGRGATRSEEHTSELQSLAYLVCRLLLEKKKNNLHSTQPSTTNPF